MLGLMNRCSAASANNLLLYWEVFLRWTYWGVEKEKYKKNMVIYQNVYCMFGHLGFCWQALNFLVY